MSAQDHPRIGQGAECSRRQVLIPPVGLEGIMACPTPTRAIVLFAHGSGSSRLSPRNNYVATALNEAGLGTLLFDLLRPEEAMDRENVFDIPLLAERLETARKWLAGQKQARDLPVGYFGASTGAAAALMAASATPSHVYAVVSRGGRPDLAESTLAGVRAPTLLIVGGRDPQVLGLNREAYARLACEKTLEVVAGAGHLFEEPGALNRVIELTRHWFSDHLDDTASRIEP